MECPHLTDNVKLKTDAIILQKSWRCKVCRTVDSPWMCLCCGFVGCGRYVCGHAKDHHQEMTGHSVCIECQQFSVFCYACDEFVYNDTVDGLVESVRSLLVGQKTSAADDSSSGSSGQGRRKRARLSDPVLASSSVENRLRPRKPSIGDVTSPLSACKAVGLRNLGNTCFMNAVLQSLNNIQEFRRYMNDLPSLTDIHKNKQVVKPKGQSVRRNCLNGDLMTEELRKVLLEFSTATQTISPEALFSIIWKVVPRFRGYQQQDAHEFLRYMLDRLHTELLTLLPSIKAAASPSAGKHSIVTSVFGGTLQNEVKCLVCKADFKKLDPFLDISLDIPERFVQPKKAKECASASQCTLSDCLDLFLDVEELSDTELYFCNNCKKHQKSTKKFWIRRLPNVLCLHVKRFRWSSHYRVKVDTPLQFPVRALDMSACLLSERLSRSGGDAAGGQLYDLAAVVVHHGTGAGSGHYTAFASHRDCWYHFNDSTVRRVDERQVADCKAYILFYIRRQFKPPRLSSCGRS